MDRHKKRRKHKTREIYYLPVNDQLVEVTADVYNAYYEERRLATYMLEQEDVNGVVSYNALDDGEILGEEIVLDPSFPSAEDELLSRELLDLLHRSILTLSEEDQQLIHAIFYDGMTQQEYAQKIDITQPAVCRKLKRVLSKLRRMLTF